ncbi:hypothetical protein H6F61_19355 [Cyanobacteria bacterium FACHB-472]|nr:hypothetical protein [Cyanobacteria bacterium FACHB-472]
MKRSLLLVILPTALLKRGADAVIAIDFNPATHNRSAYPQRDLGPCPVYILRRPDTFINNPVICCSFPLQEVL